MRNRFGVAQFWLTVTPPEHDNLELLRIDILRDLKAWNRTDIIFTRKECTFDDIPDEILKHARLRLSISNKYPALAARVFKRTISQIYNDI